MNLAASIKEIVNSKNLSEELVLDAVKSVLIEAYQDFFGAKDIQFNIDLNKNIFQVLIAKNIVDRVRDPRVEISEAEAKEILNVEKISKRTKAVNIPYDPINDYSPAEIIKISQSILDKIKDYENNSISYEFSKKKIQIVSGSIVKISSNGNIFVDLKKTLACLPYSEQSPLEHYENGDIIKAIVLSVDSSSESKSKRKLQVTLSRKSPNLIKELLKIEVPEISDEVIEVKSVVRIAGYKTKVLVHTNTNTDPIGACIGPHGIRITSIIKEIGGEKIDIIKYSEDKKELIENALTPAKIIRVILNTQDNEEKAYAITSEDQLPYAFGKQKQNIILASKICKQKIEIKTLSEVESENIEESNVTELRNMFGTNLSILNLSEDLIQKIHEHKIFSVESLAKVHIENDYEQFTGLTPDEITLIQEQMSSNVEIESEHSTEETKELLDSTPLSDIQELKTEWIEVLNKHHIFSIESLVIQINTDELNSVKNLTSEDKANIVQILMDNIEIED